MFYKLIKVKMNINSLQSVYFHLMYPQFFPASAEGDEVNPFCKKIKTKNPLFGPA